ncbi:MAG TPA: hypothetical protein VNL18_16615 [Gemmatimonadales bacterium]|nr:hypothetical protein [Gemmatimonadales bacterium]
MAPDVRFVERRAAHKQEADAGTAVAEGEPKAPPREGEETTLPIPEHLRRLWLACGLEDEQ